MRRRAFIAALGGAAAWPVAARAQQPTVPAIGYLHPGSGGIPRDLTAFRRGLGELGYTEGSNLVIEFRFAHWRPEQLRGLASELVEKRVAVIFASGGVQPALAAREATSSIPVVFANGSDPIATGLVRSLNKPGGNLTGVTFFTGVLPAKSLELLHEAVPGVSTVGVLVNVNTMTRESRLAEVEAASRALGVRLQPVSVDGIDELETALSRLVQERIHTVLLVAEPIFRNHHELVASLASRYSISMMTFGRDFVEAGALMSYGTDISQSFYQAGVYVGRILKGEKPADLPVMQPTKFELVVNLKTAKALGIEIAPTLLARADEVIE